MWYLFLYDFNLFLNVESKVYRISLLILRLQRMFGYSNGSSLVSLIYLIFLGYIIFVVIFLILIVLGIEESFVLVFDFSGQLVFKEEDLLNM